MCCCCNLLAAALAHGQATAGAEGTVGGRQVQRHFSALRARIPIDIAKGLEGDLARDRVMQEDMVKRVRCGAERCRVRIVRTSCAGDGRATGDPVDVLLEPAPVASTEQSYLRSLFPVITTERSWFCILPNWFKSAKGVSWPSTPSC